MDEGEARDGKILGFQEGKEKIQAERKERFDTLMKRIRELERVRDKMNDVFMSLRVQDLAKSNALSPVTSEFEASIMELDEQIERGYKLAADKHTNDKQIADFLLSVTGWE